MTFAKFTHTGMVRGGNEDSLFARPPVFVVADGMGGAQAGEVASAMATAAFEYFLPQSSQPGEELSKLIARTNASIYEYAMSDSGRTGMGTTITAAVVRGDSVTIAHVGDSRAWLLRDGRMERLTQDHSLVAEMVRGGQLTEEEASEHPQRSVITRALGVDPEVQIDTNVIEWRPGDLFLLASDGLYGMVPEPDIEQLLKESPDLNRAALELIRAANARGGNDNISVVLFSPDGSIPEGPAAEEPGAGAGAEETPTEEYSGADDPEGAAVRPRRTPVLARVRSFFAGTAGSVIIGLTIVASLIGGAFVASRFVYYVGVEGENVAVYRGLPYELGPITFFDLYRASSVKADELEPFEQERVTRGNLQTKGSAEQFLDNLVIADKRKKDEEERILREAEKANKD